jgi:spermine oxidase
MTSEGAPPPVLKFLCPRRILWVLRRLCSSKSGEKCDTTAKKPAKPTDFEVCTIADCMVDPCKPEPAVVIVGAGIAGLSAAQRLAQCGINNFTVLEATDR